MKDLTKNNVQFGLMKPKDQKRLRKVEAARAAQEARLRQYLEHGEVAKDMEWGAK